MAKKLYAVETLSIFRNMIFFETDDNENLKERVDHALNNNDTLDGNLKDGGQQFIIETISDISEITEEEFVKLFDKYNDYLASWNIEKKKTHINTFDANTES